MSLFTTSKREVNEANANTPINNSKFICPELKPFSAKSSNDSSTNTNLAKE